MKCSINTAGDNSRSALTSNRFLGLMPTYMQNDGVLCTKLVCFYQREEGSRLPSTQATVLLLDPQFGNVKAVSEPGCHPLNCLIRRLSACSHSAGDGWRGHHMHEDGSRLCHLCEGFSMNVFARVCHFSDPGLTVQPCVPTAADAPSGRGARHPGNRQTGPEPLQRFHRNVVV